MSTLSQEKTTLPHIRLKDRTLSLAALKYISLETSEKFKIISFKVTDDSLHIGVVYPDQLKQGFYISLKDLGKKINKTIKLFQVDTNSFKFALAQYQEKSSPPPPPLFELGKTVAFKYLKRVPYDYAVKHHIACVDFAEPNTYWFLVDENKIEESQVTLSYIEEKNKINAFAIPIALEQISSLLEYYNVLALQEKKSAARIQEDQKKQAVKDGIKKQKEDDLFDFDAENNDHESSDVILASGVVVPDIQAEILSGEVKKRGLAGMWQTVSQSIIAKDDEIPFSLESQDKSESTKDPEPEKDVISVEKKIEPVHDTLKERVSTTDQSEITIEPSAIEIDEPEDIKEEDVVHSDPDPDRANAASKPKGRPSHEDDLGKLLNKSVDSKDELIGHIKSGSIPLIVAATVNFAIHEKASDIHIESFEDEVRIRFRMDGQLMDIVKIPPDVHSAVVSRIKILSKLRLDETRVPQDGRFDVNFNEAQVDVRVSILPTVHGEKVVMRILDKSKGVSSLDSLGIDGVAFRNLTDSVKKPYGICLATGPTGSGKSTSLYALLKLIALPNVNVITLEDPIEYEMKGINQSQVRPKIGFTFAEGLRSVLRQDPNIIMVGEVRDGETAAMTIQSALTGHMVLSTLHTNDAAGAIPRLNNMGIEPFLITSALNSVMGQRLVRRICENCKEKISLPEGVKDSFMREIDEVFKKHPDEAARLNGGSDFYHGSGCDRCRRSGYQGRLGVYEVLVMSEKLENLTIKNAPSSEIKEEARSEGMITMYEDGLIKAASGITTLDEVLRETTNK